MRGCILTLCDLAALATVSGLVAACVCQMQRSNLEACWKRRLNEECL